MKIGGGEEFRVLVEDRSGKRIIFNQLREVITGGEQSAERKYKVPASMGVLGEVNWKHWYREVSTDEFVFGVGTWYT